MCAVAAENAVSNTVAVSAVCAVAAENAVSNTVAVSAVCAVAAENAVVANTVAVQQALSVLLLRRMLLQILFL